MTILLWTCLGLALAYVGAEAFIRGSVSVARRFRIPPLVVGLTVISWGTSAPELAVSLDAAVNNNVGVAVGNVLGSNIFNVGFILGLSSLVCPIAVKLRLIRFDIPILAVISILTFGALYDSQLTRIEGILLLTAFLLYVAATFYLLKKGASQEVVQEFAEAEPRRFNSILVACLCIVGGLAVLIYGADLLVDGAVELARTLGVTETVIGLTVVAAGTSLPELVTSLVAAARKEPDVAVGNIVGSNIFNVTCILGLSSTITPIAAIDIGRIELIALVIAAVVLIPLTWGDFILKRWEGVVLLSAYVVYVTFLWL